MHFFIIYKLKNTQQISPKMLETIKIIMGQTNLGNRRFLIINGILILGIIFAIAFLWFDKKLYAQVSLLVSLVALFLNRPRDVFMRRYNRVHNEQTNIELEEQNNLHNFY